MSNSVAPSGWNTVTPRIVCTDTAALLDFLRTVFDAEGDYEPGRPSVAKIGDSQIMISTTDERPLTAAFLYVYVADADATFKKAVDAGAEVIEAPVLTPYGDRRWMFDDPWGNTWQVANLDGR